jgi:hypothetical protein
MNALEREEVLNAEMSDPSDRFGFFLPRVSWLREIEAEGCVVAHKRETRRQTAEIAYSETSNHNPEPGCCTLAVRRPGKAQKV